MDWSGIGGNVAQGLFGIYSANKAYTRQKEMMKNAHQWEVEDLRKAGLNPILSATGGSGASASSVGMAVSPDFGSSATSSSANAVARKGLTIQDKVADNTVKVGESQIALNKENSYKAMNDSLYSAAQSMYQMNLLKLSQEYGGEMYKADIALKLANASAVIQNANSSAVQSYALANKLGKESNLLQTESDSGLNFTKHGVMGTITGILDRLKNLGRDASISSATEGGD